MECLSRGREERGPESPENSFGRFLDSELELEEIVREIADLSRFRRGRRRGFSRERERERERERDVVIPAQSCAEKSSVAALSASLNGTRGEQR
jgi:hypothetical protein